MINSNVYSEVYEILSYMDKATVMKIPIEILETIKSERNREYISRINPEDIFNPNNIEEKTLEILACLDVNYWMDKTKKEKLEFKNRQRIRIEEQEKKRKYGDYDLFEKKSEKYNLNKTNEENYLAEPKETLFDKIISNIKRIFKFHK